MIIVTRFIRLKIFRKFSFDGVFLQHSLIERINPVQFSKERSNIMLQWKPDVYFTPPAINQLYLRPNGYLLQKICLSLHLSFLCIVWLWAIPYATLHYSNHWGWAFPLNASADIPAIHRVACQITCECVI